MKRFWFGLFTLLIGIGLAGCQCGPKHVEEAPPPPAIVTPAPQPPPPPPPLPPKKERG